MYSTSTQLLCSFFNSGLKNESFLLVTQVSCCIVFLVNIFTMLNLSKSWDKTFASVPTRDAG